jgi:hypothetical protein
VRLEPLQPPAIAGRPAPKQLTVDFDHHPCGQADEIYDERSDQGLAAKLEPVEPARAQARPQIPLDAAHRVAEVSRELNAGKWHCTQQHPGG